RGLRDPDQRAGGRLQPGHTLHPAHRGPGGRSSRPQRLRRRAGRPARRPPMRSRANLPVFVAYVLLGLLATAFLAAQMGGEFGFGGYRVDAIFKSGAELVAGDDVSMSGLRVGKVESLTPLAGATRVSMLLHQDFTPVFKDARAVIRQKNLLGEAYVELNRGHASQGAITQGGTIDQDHTLTPVEVDEVLNALDRQVRYQLNLVITTLGQA